MTSKSIAETLRNSGICVCPNFLSLKALKNTYEDLSRIRAQGLFRQARVGRGDKPESTDVVRNDNTYWLDRRLKSGAQILLWRKIDLLQRALNRELLLGLTDFEGHYADYPENGFYQRHHDSFQSRSRREVSFILYLNQNWQPSDGGRLRVYSSDANGVESYRDIDPVGGTMVCFLSRETEHEVLLSRKRRFSLSGWFSSRGTAR